MKDGFLPIIGKWKYRKSPYFSILVGISQTKAVYLDDIPVEWDEYIHTDVVVSLQKPGHFFAVIEKSYESRFAVRYKLAELEVDACLELNKSCLKTTFGFVPDAFFIVRNGK